MPQNPHEYWVWRVIQHGLERRFLNNLNLVSCKYPSVTVRVHKGLSEDKLAHLLCEGKKGYFDFVYVDGSHQAPDVLTDAVLAFKLTKTGGLMIFDDYLWAENLTGGVDPIRSPKIAVDAFTNIFCRKIRIIQAPLYQIFLQKISD
jgi:hypothetical protein